MRVQAIFNPSNFEEQFNQQVADERYVRSVGGAALLTRRTLASAQLVNSGTDTIVNYNTADLYQNGTTGLTYSSGTFTNSSGNTRVIQVSYTVAYPANTTGYRLAWIAVNGLNGQRRFATSDVDANAQAESMCQGSATLVLTPGDTFAIYTWQNSGSQLDIATAALGMLAGFATRMQVVVLQ